MTLQRIPTTTLSLLAAMLGLYVLVAEQSLLYFSPADIAQGEYWRLLTGHLAHADREHLVWNSLGLAVLGTLVEKRSPSMLWAALIAGLITVSGLLMTPFAPLDNYCGLSGVLNSLLVVALWLEWQASRSWLVPVIAMGSALKVLVEISLGASVVTHISWPPYAWSHAAGMLGGLVVVCAGTLNRIVISSRAPYSRCRKPPVPALPPS